MNNPCKESPASDTEPPGAGGDDGEQLASLGYIDCLQYCLEQRGARLSKALLMGIAGESFRLCFDRNDPERGIEVVSHNPLRAACAGLGYRCDIIFRPEARQAIEALQQDLAARGNAILHAQTGWVVVERQAGDAGRLRVRRANGRSESWPAARLEQVWRREPGLLELGLEGYYYFVIGDKEREPEERETAMASLRRGVRLLTRKSRLRHCAAGLAAYDEVLDSLFGKPRSEAHRARVARKYALWNRLALTYLRDSRRAAEQYLMLIRPHFDDEAQEHLRKAAESFGKAARALAEVPPLSEAPEADPEQRPLTSQERRALRAYALLRRKAASRVRRARAAEQEALTEMRRALEAAERKKEQ